MFDNDDPPGTYLNQYSSDVTSSKEFQGTAIDLVRCLSCSDELFGDGVTVAANASMH